MNTLKPNRLLREKSPYLQQHAYNPVDWYPWGDEAFEKAQRENKPILVSIGYSTCHWCHVMERESYEDPDVAALMNRYLVNIKIDREERPDVDKIYMTAVSAMTGQGGWPLNMFLTPDRRPIYGGTYFPPESKWGQPAWKDVVAQIGEAWTTPEDREKMLSAAAHITDALKKFVQTSRPPAEGDPVWLEQGYRSFEETYDSTRGGFSGAPKFPMPVYHNFLLRYYARTKAKNALEMSLHTLREMAKGGVYDHLGGGFARYSTDAHWHVPHFEKMLYDNAQLAVNYLEAFQITRDPEFERVARETLAYIQRDMTDPQGGFYSAEDADSFESKAAKEKKEGAFYVWERAEVMTIVGQQAGDLCAFRYGVREGGNAAQDPHGEFIGKNILYIAHSLPETAREFKLSEADAARWLEEAKAKLFAARAQRPRPHRDDKIISGWNGLMITAFAKAFQILGEEAYVESAQKAARFLRQQLYDASSQQLYRRWRTADSSSAGTAGNDDVKAIADDYAFLIQGLLDLYEADFSLEWLDWASELQEAQNTRFYDADAGGYFMTAADQDAHLLLRVKEDTDNVEPSASSVGALNLLRLAQMMDRADWQEMAEKTLRGFGMTLKESPRALPQMLVALDYALTEPRQIVIAGKTDAPDAQRLVRTLHRHFIPVKIVLSAEGSRLPFAQAMKPIQGQAAAYVCVRHTCQTPTDDPDEFERQVSAL